MTGLAAWSMATFPHLNFSPASAGLFRLARQANAMPHVVAGNDAESVVLNLVQPESTGRAVLALSSVGAGASRHQTQGRQPGPDSPGAPCHIASIGGSAAKLSEVGGKADMHYGHDSPLARIRKTRPSPQGHRSRRHASRAQPEILVLLRKADLLLVLQRRDLSGDLRFSDRRGSRP